jgi:hypothetical protein
VSTSLFHVTSSNNPCHFGLEAVSEGLLTILNSLICPIILVRGNRTRRGKTPGRGAWIINGMHSTIVICLGVSMAYGFCRKWRSGVLPATRRTCSGARMAHWQDRFLGIGELPPELSIFEIAFFSRLSHGTLLRSRRNFDRNIVSRLPFNLALCA